MDIPPADTPEFDEYALACLAKSSIIATTTVTRITRPLVEHPPVFERDECGAKRRVWGHFVEWTPTFAELPGKTRFLFSRDKDQHIDFKPGMKVSAKKEYIELESYADKVTFMNTNKAHLYEIIKSVDDPTNTFIDIDRHDTKYTWKVVAKAMCAAVDGFLEDTGIAGGLRIEVGRNAQIAESSTPVRTSLHFVLAIAMENASEHMRFTNALRAWVTTRADAFPELMEGDECVIDKGLHNNCRNFRFPYQSKRYAVYSVPFVPVMGSSKLASDHAVVCHVGSPPAVPADINRHLGQVAVLQPRVIPAKHKASPLVMKAARPIAMNELLQKYTDLFNSKAPLVELMQAPMRVKYVTQLEGGVTAYTLDDARCPYAGRKHKSNHVYITSHPHAKKTSSNLDAHKDLHVHCHDPDCRKTYSTPYIVRHSDTLESMLHDDMNPKSMHPQAKNIQWDEDYDEPSMRPLPVRPLVCVRAGMGIGKTKAMHAVVRENCGAATKALIVTFSKSLAMKLRGDFADLEFECYNDVKGDIFSSRVIVCLDSLWRVTTRNFDFVFIDEAVSVFLHFNSPLMTRSSENSALLELLITQSCANVYLVDACIDQTFTKYLADYFGDAKTVKPYWIRNRHVRPSNRVANVLVSRQSGNAIEENQLIVSAIEKVMDLINKGKRVVVCSSTKRFAVALEQYVLNKRAETRMLVYHSDSCESLSDVNDLWRSCDLLIYSPSISAGVSFEREHFDSMVAFLVNSNFTPSVDISLQQLFRVRNLTDGDMSIYVQDSTGNDDLPCTESQVEEMLSKDVSTLNKYCLSSQLSSLAQHKIVGDVVRYDPDRMSYRVIKGIVLMRHRSLVHFVDLLTGSLREDYGMTVTTKALEVKEDTDVDIELLSTCKVSEFPPFKSIENLAMSEDGLEKYKQLCNNGDKLTPVERAEKMLYELAIRLWKIPADKIDKNFYNFFVADQCAFEKYHRAKRYVMMNIAPVAVHRQTLKTKMASIMTCSDSNIEFYKTRLKQHYMRLIAGQTLLSLILKDEQQDELRSKGGVTITIAEVEHGGSRFRMQLGEEELESTLKLFGIKETTTGFISTRKIMKVAFDIDMQRQDKRSNMAGFKKIDMMLTELGFVEAYNPKLLSPIRRG
jgi:hypothetical protein